MRLFKKLWPRLTWLWPFVFILGVWFVLFKPFFAKGLLPMPADIIAGLYYPWLDYKWGYSVGVPVKNPLISDIPSLLYPWRSFAIDELKAGRWPLWNPYYFDGMPLLANFQSAVFSYVNLFFLFFSKPIAWALGVMTSPLLTMIFMFLFLRHKNLSRISSLLGSVVFSLSGFEIAWLEYNVHGHTAMFLPLLLFLIDKIFGKRRKIWLLLLPIFVACQVFTGYIPVVIYTYLICLLYVGYFYLLPDLKKKKFADLKKYALLGLFWIWGIVLASIQLLPGWELTKNSIRLTDPTVEASNASYLPVINLITLLAPDFFGNPATGNYFGRAFYDNFYFFVGTGVLIFVFYSLFFLRKERSVRFWFLTLALSFILVFKNPLGIFLGKLLFLSGGVASKALFITDFSLALLAGYGFDLFLKEDLKKRRKIFVPISLMVILSLFAVLAAMKMGQNFQIVAMRNLVIPFMVLFFCSVVLFVMNKFFKSMIFQVIFLLLISFQLLYSAKKYLPFSKEELLFPKTPVIDFLLEQKSRTNEPFRVELGEVIPQNFLMPYCLSTTSGYDALLPRQTGEFLSFLELGKISEKISRVQLIKNYDSPLFPIINTKYILAKKTNKDGVFSPEGKPPDLFLSPRYKLVFEDRTVQVYEDNKFLPRAFWVHDFSESSEDGARSFGEKKVDFIPPLQPAKLDSLEWVENSPRKKVLVAQSDQPGFVFLSESYFPGWNVFVDGISVELLRANYNFQAVQIGGGKHLISFEYRPQSFRLGSLITLFSLVQLLFLSILFLVRSIWEKVF